MSILNPPNITKIADKDTPSRQLKINEDGSVNGVITNSIDSSSGYLVVISPEHFSVHKGFSYSLTTILPNLASNTSTYIEFIVPQNVILATQSFNIVCDKLIRTRFYENPTLSDGNIPMSVINRNRISNNVMSSVLYGNPTNITNNGTVLLRTLLFGDLGINGIFVTPLPPNSSDTLGFDLKAGKYLLEITNLSADITSVLFLNLDMHEIIAV